MKNFNKTVFSVLLLLVALVFGQTAQATVTEPMTFEGYSNTNGNTSLHVWRIQGLLGNTSSHQSVSGTSQTFGKVYLEFVPNANHKPMPMPTVTYGNTTLTQGTDYTLSWSNNGSAGTGTSYWVRTHRIPSSVHRPIARRDLR